MISDAQLERGLPHSGGTKHSIIGAGFDATLSNGASAGDGQGVNANDSALSGAFRNTPHRSTRSSNAVALMLPQLTKTAHDAIEADWEVTYCIRNVRPARRFKLMRFQSLVKNDESKTKIQFNGEGAESGHPQAGEGNYRPA